VNSISHLTSNRRTFLTMAALTAGTAITGCETTPRLTTPASLPEALAKPLDLSEAERDRRWSALKALLRRAKVDVLVLPESNDAQAIADIRYLLRYARTHTTVLFFVDREPEVYTDFGAEFTWLRRASWTQATTRYSSDVHGAVVDRLREVGSALSIGVADRNALTPAWRDVLDSASRGAVVNVGDVVKSMRVIKSQEEIALISRSAAIADRAIAEGISKARIGIPQYMLNANVDYAVISAGAEYTDGAFFVYSPRPMTYGVAVPYLADNPLQTGDFAMMEASPKYRGYSSQLATHVSFGQPPDQYRRMYDLSLQARRAGLELLRPGENLGNVVSRMREVVQPSAFVFAGGAAGHVAGLTMAEPRITVGVDLELKPGMAMTIHAVVTNSAQEDVIRADTYLITDDGHRRLNTLDERLAIV
jgi:Xaa-Pro dipeptidase